ncbi:MAG: hypothetical protein EBX41_01830 [Chitinophagia bacterium]|nr:hypothetical protein [Chitinophagia bacterium]
MMNALRYSFLTAIVSLAAFAARSQQLKGTILDEKKQPIINASVKVSSGGMLKAGVVTDYDGVFDVKPLEAGNYTVEISYVGYTTIKMEGVLVSATGITPLDLEMKRENDGSGKVLKEATIKWKKPLVNKYSTSTLMTTEDIKKVGTTSTADLVSLTPGSYQQKRNGTISADGGRGDQNLYIVDGVYAYGSAGTNMSQGSIEQLEVLSSGISAKYGDVSGAVINITTKGVSQKYAGYARLQHSVDGYRNNLVSASISGPILKLKRGKETEKHPVMGFALGGDFYYDQNRNPAYDKQYVAKDEVRDRMYTAPLIAQADASGVPVFNYASNYITFNDLKQVKRPPNNKIKELRLNGKMDFKVSDQMKITAGGTFGFTRSDLYARTRNLFAPEATPIEDAYTTRGFLRFTQKFGKGIDTSRKSIVTNANYTVQIDFQKVHRSRQDPVFKKSIFEYGYVGKFTKQAFDFYRPNDVDSVSGRKGTILQSRTTFGVNYERDNRNPSLANYTSQLYNLFPAEFLPASIAQIQSFNGMANGDQPALTYSTFLSPGTTRSYYFMTGSNQYSLSVDANFDLKLGKVKHGIEFGLYYQQRVERSYIARANLNGIGTTSLWSQMRQLVSNVENNGLVLDKDNPIFKVGGKEYTLNDVKSGAVLPSPADTIYYKFVNKKPTQFDKNLRARLGKGANEDINIDALDPSVFSLSMFTADELLNSGKDFVTYNGYTYDGKLQSGVTNFNDFWTAKDANGNYTRPIGAFSPNYIAGYLLDKFEYKKMIFNIGVRIDRFSANTKVLKDPYSLYATKNKGQVAGSANYYNGGSHPSNISDDYVVYVDDNNSPKPNVIGYRKDDKWYDPYGNFVEDPKTLKENFTNGRDPQPYLIDNIKITDSNYNPNSAFTDYTPQVTMMPRFQVSFPIDVNNKFFAHYDIYVQRPTPTSLNNANASDYYFLTQNSNTIINNANLKSQKTYDYELGFEHVLGQSAALKIIGFYKERKNMVAVRPYLYAYPTTYYTFGNRDFSSTKGLKVFYDLRQGKDAPFGMTLSYTLQFAEGTGSGPYSNNAGGSVQISPQGLLQSFIEAGQPNLRYISALDIDSRHNIVANFDFRYGKGEGPVVGKNHIFQNAGINMVARVRSGEPYTRIANATGNTIVGTINGSRLPWHFNADLRLNKEFAVEFNRKSKNKPSDVPNKHIHKFGTFLYFQNVFNTREILGVYGYTGKPDDNGYLTSPFGQQAIPQQINAQSYIDLYKVNMYNPDNLNYARAITFGIEYNF